MPRTFIWPPPPLRDQEGGKGNKLEGIVGVDRQHRHRGAEGGCHALGGAAGESGAGELWGEGRMEEEGDREEEEEKELRGRLEEGGYRCPLVCKPLHDDGRATCMHVQLSCIIPSGMHVCVCVCARARVCVCVCACACVYVMAS
jgi:hypothetical protein